MKLVLIALLPGLGSPAVEIDQVNVWVPGVAVQGVCAFTVIGVPVGPG